MSYYKIKTCPDCGKLFEQKSATQVRCRDCQMAMRRAKDQQRAKERYIPKKPRTDPNKCKHKGRIEKTAYDRCNASSGKDGHTVVP